MFEMHRSTHPDVRANPFANKIYGHLEATSFKKNIQTLDLNKTILLIRTKIQDCHTFQNI